MGAKVTFTYKQERQIISFFENAHRSIIDPNNIDNSGVISLFRVCRDYCRRMSGKNGWGGKGIPEEEKAAARAELIENLNKLSIRFYGRL